MNNNIETIYKILLSISFLDISLFFKVNKKTYTRYYGLLIAK